MRLGMALLVIARDEAQICIIFFRRRCEVRIARECVSDLIIAHWNIPQAPLVKSRNVGYRTKRVGKKVVSRSWANCKEILTLVCKASRWFSRLPSSDVTHCSFEWVKIEGMDGQEADKVCELKVEIKDQNTNTIRATWRLLSILLKTGPAQNGLSYCPIIP